jgi:hypothetical protein
MWRPISWRNSRNWWRKVEAAQPSRILGTEAIAFAFKDAPRRSYRQIAATIRVAKALVEADAQATRIRNLPHASVVLPN